MKPGISFWLRIAVTASLAVAISASPLSSAYADKLPIKEVAKPILQGEPEDPDGTIPTGGTFVTSRTIGGQISGNTDYPIAKGEPQDPDRTRLINRVLSRAYWLLFSFRIVRH